MNYEEMCLDEIINLLRCNNVCLLSVAEDNQPYTIPMYYKLEGVNGNFIIKLRSFPTGRKMRCLNSNNKVCLYFQRFGFQTLETVVAFGTAKFKEETCCPNEMVEIKICVNEVNGRRFC